VVTYAFIASAASLFVWLVLTLFRGAFWQLRFFDDDIALHYPPPDVAAEGRSLAWPRVAAVIPARNEAASVTKLVESLARQDYAGEFHVFIVDDQSEDKTGELAAAAAQAERAENKFTIQRGQEWKPGWTGKLWAMQQGIENATAISPEYFWFTDADIAHAPDTLTRLVARAQSQSLDLASLMVMLQAKSLPERLLIPAFLYFFLQLYPPRWIENLGSRTAGAAGGCILLKRNALEKMGGLHSIRGEVIDDCALARGVKRSGGRIWMGVTRKSISLRSYQSFGEIRDLIARTAFTQLNYSGLVLAGTLLALSLTYFVPVVLLFSPQPLVWRLSLAAWALMTLTYLPTVRFYRLSPKWAMLLPLAGAFYAWATVLSAIRYWLGRGGHWKGRAQALSQ
jgi:hopene-associated glycosyltransferase HpnB